MTSIQPKPRAQQGEFIELDARAREESRIVSTWLLRLRTCLGQERQAIFEQALGIAGISLADLSRQEGLRQEQMDIVLREVRTSVPDVTLRLFNQARVRDLGLIGYAAINCDTLGRALEILYDYQNLARDQYLDRLELDGDCAVIIPTPLPGYLGDYIAIAEDSFAGNWSSFRDLLGQDAEPGQLQLSFDYPAPEYASTYYEVFGSNCRFNAEYTELRFPRQWLDIPIQSSSRASTQIFTAMCERVLGPRKSRSDTTEMVQRLLLSRPGRSVLRLEEAAEQLRLSRNQLRKRLYRAGTTYKALVLKTRMELARHYLQDTRLSVQEIAYLLDYSSPAPFSRAFKQYYGLAPDHFRQRLGVEPAASTLAGQTRA
jgi:AraC-like DNA-binding protein